MQYAKRINPDQSGEYEFYIRGNFFISPGVATHFPEPELLAELGWMPVVDRGYNPDTHRITDSHTDDGAEVYRVAVELTEDELADRLDLTLIAAKDAVKMTRHSSLVKLVACAGILGVYDINFEAAKLVTAGQGDTVLFDTITATQFAADAGAGLGMDAATWSAFIVGENSREKRKGKRIEEGYLHYYYSGFAGVDTISEINAITAEYQTFCDSLVAAEDIPAIENIVNPWE
jgi:hypothetical protein